MRERENSFIIEKIEKFLPFCHLLCIAPSQLDGIPTEATVVHVLVSKYADHLPLYRQAQIYARQGINLDRSTLADWVGKAAFLLRPIPSGCLSG
mgnify:CR=1 FL=1